jgi:tRNA(fMet)-specific endonuclease VapC
MVILDSDHMSLMEWSGSVPAKRLEDRLGRLPKEEVATTIVSFEEQTRGWMTVLAKARKMKDQVDVYGRLRRQLEIYCGLLVLNFEELAAVEFQRLRKEHPRSGAMDLKITAIALVNKATLLSKNLRDFEKIQGLQVEDWTL